MLEDEEPLYGVLAQLVGAVAFPKFCHHFALNLADTFAGKAEPATNLVECAWHAVVQPVAELDDILLTWLERAENCSNIGVAQTCDHGCFGVFGIRVLDEVTQRCFLIRTDRHV